MPKKEEFDVDKELEKISRKSNLDIRKSEYSFENQIDKIMDSKIKEFDDNKKLTSDYLSIDYSESTINRYREKLKKI